MIIVKLTILSILVTVFLALIFRAWCESNPLDAWVENYPFYAYILVGTTILDAIGIFASAIYLLFFYW